MLHSFGLDPALRSNLNVLLLCTRQVGIQKSLFAVYHGQRATPDRITATVLTRVASMIRIQRLPRLVNSTDTII